MEMATTGLPPIPDYLLIEAEKLKDRLNQGHEDLFLDKLSFVYEYISKFNEYLGKYAACKKDCSYCCNIDVQITQAEAELIHLKTQAPIKHVKHVTTGHATPCPFLSEAKSCSIYEFRPLPCRMFHAFGNPENCKPGGMQNEYGSPASNFGNNIFQALVQWLHMNNAGFGGSIGDIRDYFTR